jgi:hypothetical protein
MYWGVKVSICPIDLYKGCGPERSVILKRAEGRNLPQGFLSLTPIVPLWRREGREGTRTTLLAHGGQLTNGAAIDILGGAVCHSSLTSPVDRP